jgi:hypothetical protein
MKRQTSAVTLLVLLLSAGGIGCAGAVEPIQLPKEPPAAEQLTQLWVDPGSTPRDLFWGVGGQRYAPPADAVYEFEARDDTGFSASYDVKSPDGTEWSAKIGPEAQTEVVVSRILWGLGYHQPPVYYLPSWALKRDGSTRRESEARFRPKLANLERLDEYWRWNNNPFLGTREFKGMLIALLILNSTDLKDDNNSIYELKEPWDGASRWFVVRDVGAALGETGKLYPRRNWLEGFEKTAFIKRVNGQRIEFDYEGRHQELLTLLTPADVQWGAKLMQRLTDQQWRDAFRAGNYADAIAERFIRRIKQKIEDGLAVRPDPTLADHR